LETEQQIANQVKEKQADNEMLRREVDQKMTRLMNLRDTLPQEVIDNKTTMRIKFSFCLFVCLL